MIPFLQVITHIIAPILARVRGGPCGYRAPICCALLAVALGGFLSGPSIAQDKTGYAATILRPIIEIARHGDLRDIAFIERAFNVPLILEEENPRVDPESKARSFHQREGVFPKGRAQILLQLYDKPFALYGRLQIGSIILGSITTVTCVNRQEVRDIFSSAFGANARYVDLTDPSVDNFRVIEEKNRIVKVVAGYFGQDCLDHVVIAQDI